MLRTVLVTDEPRKNAPENSQILAISTACFRVIDLEATEVAKALATSFAPMRKPYRKPNTPPQTAIHRYCVSAAMMIVCSCEEGVVVVVEAVESWDARKEKKVMVSEDL